MIFPATPCKVTARIGSDENGRPTWGARVQTLCTVVKLSDEAKRTSYKSTEGAARGNSFEPSSDAKLLFSGSADMGVGYRVDVLGLSLSVVSVQQRIENITGVLDHYEVGLKNHGS